MKWTVYVDLSLTLIILITTARKTGGFCLPRTTVKGWTASTTSLYATVSSSTKIATNESYNLVAMQAETLKDPRTNVLSQDPLIYTIHHLLSAKECRAYQQYAEKINRPMTRSNPPEVSLDIGKLWPLSILSMLAGVPPVARVLQDGGSADHSMQIIAQAALPNIGIALSTSLLLAFGFILPLVRFQANHSSRTSVAVALNQPDDMMFVKDLVNRVSTSTNHAWDKWEAPVITRYDPGAVFAKHGDASPTRGSEWMDAGGQRVITCICYLNDIVEGGGETYFNVLKFGVEPEPGKALIFFPADSLSAVADDRTIHESLPPQGTKWIVQMFGRTSRVPPPLGLPDDFVYLADETRP
ncbi:hypothetical protein MPSEU_000126000 [Mayamaea pseudoterrestris]|nr:hypothetical protein MPSEU_000124700 [Mayamaea pseudoterrestris]GKY91539.1 hypothetical protein MPSEU_000126000 [Mayamaea pseudoterrestris]